MLNNDVKPSTLSRLELLKLAQTLHVSDADVMTRAELRAAIERARKPEPRAAAQPVTWLGVARRLLASIVEQGLHLPDAAAVIRGEVQARSFPSGPPPVATVTLARIYAAQGHLERGISTLDEVLKSDPDHDLARDLRAQLLHSLEEKRRQEREQRAAEGAASRAATQAESELEAVVAEESSPASELLEAVPADEITLSGGAEPLDLEPSEPSAAAPLEEVTPAVEAAPIEPAPAPLEAAPLDVAPLEAAPVEPAPVEPLPLETPPLEAAPSAVEAPPLEVEAAPLEAAPLEVEAAPLEAPPLEVEAAPLEAPPLETVPGAVIAPVEPRSAGLVLIETGEPSTYLYWELASPAPAGNGEPHWLYVVTHTAHGAGSERRERRLPIYRPSGALRIEGLPPRAIVRAKLSRSEAPEAPALVVAAAVWASEARTLERAELRFVPHGAAQPAALQPAALAARAADLLASAAPLYY